MQVHTKKENFFQSSNDSIKFTHQTNIAKQRSNSVEENQGLNQQISLSSGRQLKKFALRNSSVSNKKVFEKAGIKKNLFDLIQVHEKNTNVSQRKGNSIQQKLGQDLQEMINTPENKSGRLDNLNIVKQTLQGKQVQKADLKQIVKHQSR